MRHTVMAIAAAIGVMCGASAETPNYRFFFQGDNNSFRAYIDLNNQSVEGNGYRDVFIRLDSFDSSMNDMWKYYYSNPERVSYATETYAVDCSSRMTQERILTLFDSAGTLLSQTDLKKPIKVPDASTMSFYVLKEVCGG